MSGLRYCSHHCGHAPAEGGVWRTTRHRAGRGRGKRWICGACEALIEQGRGKSYNPEVLAREAAERAPA